MVPQALEFATQPFIDEYVVGYQRQFPLDMSLDVSVTAKAYRDQYGQTEINGFWPDAPGQPFGGFGRVAPNSGQIFRLTNMSWSTAKYRGVMITVAKTPRAKASKRSSVRIPRLKRAPRRR